MAAVTFPVKVNPKQSEDLTALALSADTEKLILRSREGDERAFQELYGEYSRRVLNFSYRLLGSREAAEEVLQETFISVYRNLPSLKDITRFEPWLFMIARNFVYQVFRRNKPPVRSLDETDEDHRQILHLESDDGSPEDGVLDREIRQAARKAIQGLSLKFREVFVLAVLEGYSYQEVAEMVGRNVQSVKTDIHRARLKIREKLAPFLKPAEDDHGL